MMSREAPPQQQQQQQQPWVTTAPQHNNNNAMLRNNGHECADSKVPRPPPPVRAGASRSTRWTNQQQQAGTSPPSSAPGGGVPRAQRTCGVCGDRARSLHFGGLSCDSCKAFFRRAVQSGAFKNFQCPHQAAGWSQYCVINVASRKSCQKCRFERCVQIGMEVSWVMSEAERQRLLNARLAKRRKLEADAAAPPPTSSTSSPPHTSPTLPPAPKPMQDYLWPLKPDNVCLESFMSSSEVVSVRDVKHAWVGALQYLPPTPLEGVDLTQGVDHVKLVRSMAGSIQRFQMFAQPLLEVADMLDEDKKALLQGSMLEMCILRGALNHVRGKVLFERYFPARLHDIHCRFVKGLQELALDQTTLLLFLMVILLSPERPALVQPRNVEKIQEYYLMLLNKYIGGRYGMVKAASLYPKLLSKMADLRELSDCHQEQNLLFAQHEVQTMKQELHRIQQPDNLFQAPQKIFIDEAHHIANSSPQLTPEPTTPNTSFSQASLSTSPQSKAASMHSPLSYTTVNSVSSPCDSVSSTSQRFFPQTPPFTESSSDDLYLHMAPFDDKEQDQFFPSFLCLPSPDLEPVRACSDNVTTRPQDFQPCCFSVQQRATTHNGMGRYTFYDQSGLSGVYVSGEHFSLEKGSDQGGPSFEECQALVQQCLHQDGGPSASILFSPPTSSGHAESSSSFEHYTTPAEYNLHDSSTETYLVSTYR